jgi:hypothetical protein
MARFTDSHAKYFAHELTKRCASDSIEKLAGALVDAQVDLKPHQVEAALFAFKSPLSKGAILADEAGLGKTIEAGDEVPGGTQSTAIRCWRCAVPGIMAPWIRCLYGTDSGYGKCQHD